MDKYTAKDHCFVICAYKENPYLEDCINSLINQTIKSNIVIETSTPNNHIESLANKYNLEIIVNRSKNGCAQDWNYGFEHVPHKIVTIAHQDDIYYNDYLSKILEYSNKSTNPIIVYTNYDDIKNNDIVHKNTNLSIKRLLNSHMKNSNNWGKYKAKRKTLRFGNAISCPSVTLFREKIGNRPFDETYKCNCDYKTWLNLLSLDGDFVYIPDTLMAHRIYEESHTSIYFNDSTRQSEDKQIIESLWHKPWSNIVYYFYAKSQNNNQIK